MKRHCTILPALGLPPKRIVAGPGDAIAIEDGHVVLNGKRQDEPFIAACHPADDCNFPKPITIPKDHWYMLGDNRASDDSRFRGPVPSVWIIGKVKTSPPSRD